MDANYVLGIFLVLCIALILVGGTYDLFRCLKEKRKRQGR